MQIDPEGKATRIEGDDNPENAALTDEGTQLVAEGLPDLLFVSQPHALSEHTDLSSLVELARSNGAAMKARGSGRILISALAALPMQRHPDRSMEMSTANALMRGVTMALGPQVMVNTPGAGAIGGGTIAETRTAALFPCDPANDNLTGQTLSANGGWSAGYGHNF